MILYSVIVFLSILSFLFSDNNPILYKYQLRGFYVKEKNKAIQSIINNTYNIIHKGVVQRAIVGKTKATFTLLCFVEYDRPRRSTIIGINDEMLVLQKTYNISFDHLRIQILDKLKMGFPDSILIWEKEEESGTNPNNCVHYTFVW
jgi:hypothetical protein